jgi:hypothetical protein
MNVAVQQKKRIGEQMASMSMVDESLSIMSVATSCKAGFLGDLAVGFLERRRADS